MQNIIASKTLKVQVRRYLTGPLIFTITTKTPTQTHRSDSAPGASPLAVAVCVSISQRVTGVTDILDVLHELSAAVFNHRMGVEGPVSGRGRVPALGSLRRQRQVEGGAVGSALVRSWPRGHMCLLIGLGGAGT